jgi:hypothetical protein
MKKFKLHFSYEDHHGTSRTLETIVDCSRTEYQTEQEQFNHCDNALHNAIAEIAIELHRPVGFIANVLMSVPRPAPPLHAMGLTTPDESPFYEAGKLLAEQWMDHDIEIEKEEAEEA